MKKNLFSTLLALLTIGAMLTCVGCKNYDDDISDINKKLSTAQGDITTLQGQVSSLESTVSGMQSTLTEVKNQLAKCADETDIAVLQAEIEVLEAAIDACEKAMADSKAALEKKIDDHAAVAAQTYATITALSEARAALEKTISDGLKEVKEAAEKAKAEMDTVISEIKANIESIKNQLKSYYDADTVEKKLAELLDSLLSVSNPFATYISVYNVAVWNPASTTTAIAQLKKIAEVYPEIGELKKGDEVIDANDIAFNVNPSSVDLSNGYSFSFVDVEGNDTGWKLGNPAKGYGYYGYDIVDLVFSTKASYDGAWHVEVLDMPDDWDWNEDSYTTAALSVASSDGSKTAQSSFTYRIGANYVYPDEFNVTPQDRTVPYLKYIEGYDMVADGVFSFDPENDEPVYRYVIECTNATQVEVYGLTVEGDVLYVANPPERTDAKIDVKMTAVSMRGTTSEAKAKITLGHQVTYTEIELPLQSVTLGKDMKGEYNLVRIPVADFGMTKAELHNLFWAIRTAQGGPVLYMIDSSNYQSYEYAVYTSANVGELYFYDASGNEISTGVSVTDFVDKVAYFGWNVSPKTAIPSTNVHSDGSIVGTYTLAITIEGETKDEDPVAYLVTVPVEMVNYDTVDQIMLIPALCKDGVLQVVGTPRGDQIEYTLQNAFVSADNGMTSVDGTTFADVAYIEAGIEDGISWVKNDSKTLIVPINNNSASVVNAPYGTFPAGSKLLYTPHEFVAAYEAFQNPYNLRSLVFKAEVISAVYSAKPEDVIEVNDQELYSTDTEKDGTTPNSFNINDVVEEAIYAYGPYAGDEYAVFSYWTATTYNNSYWTCWDSGNNSSLIQGVKNANNYSTVTVNQNPEGLTIAILNKYDANCLMKDENGNYIQISLDWDLSVLRGLNFTEQDIFDLKSKDVKSLYLNAAMIGGVYESWNKYYSTITDFEGKYVRANDTEIAEADKDHIAAYKKVESNFRFKYDQQAVDPKKSVSRSSELKEVKFTFANQTLAEKFFTQTGSTNFTWTNPYEDSNATCSVTAKSTIDSEFESHLVGGKLDFDANLKITDTWGMTMTIPVKVTYVHNN